MTQIGHFLCLLWGCLIGHFIVYGWCKIWDFITSKRICVPEIKYDVTDNPILSLKNRLGQAYVASHDQTVKKLLHRLLEYVEWIDNWHKEQVLIMESERNGYERMCKQVQAELESERSKNAELEKQLKDAELKNEQLRQMLKLNIGKPLFTPQDWQNTYGKEPIPVENFKTEEALKRAINIQTGAIIHIDSEDLNRYSVGRGPDGSLLKDEPPINNEEFVQKLRDWWGLEAEKAVEIAMPETVKKKQDDGWIDAIEAAREPDKWPEYMAKVEGVPKGFNKYKVTLYDNKKNETIETELCGANIYDALKSVDEERYSAIGYRCIMRNKGWC